MACLHLVRSDCQDLNSHPMEVCHVPSTTAIYVTIRAELAATLTTAPATQLDNLALVVATAAATQRGLLDAFARVLPLNILATSREQRLRRFLVNRASLSPPSIIPSCPSALQPRQLLWSGPLNVLMGVPARMGPPPQVVVSPASASPLRPAR